MSGRQHEEESVEDLRASIRSRDEFLSIAAHELRNPMHALSLEASGALRAAHQNGDKVIIKRLERMVLAINRYVQRANILLDVSRINAGQLHLNRESVDFARVVAEAVESYEAEALHHGVVITASLPATLVGRWDRVALEQIASNLISNAIKYGSGKPVEIRLASLDDGVEFVVRDHGMGISDADQQRVFEQFEQVMTGERRVGFGIGLWLVRSVVEAHAGHIDIESALGTGSMFRVCLPLDEGDGGKNDR